MRQDAQEQPECELLVRDLFTYPGYHTLRYLNCFAGLASDFCKILDTLAIF